MHRQQLRDGGRDKTLVLLLGEGVLDCFEPCNQSAHSQLRQLILDLRHLKPPEMLVISRQSSVISHQSSVTSHESRVARRELGRVCRSPGCASLVSGCKSLPDS